MGDDSRHPHDTTTTKEKAMKWQIIRAEIFWVYFCHYSL
jgi:hypothetical protein